MKIAKSSLLAVLESNFLPAEAVPENAAYMVDGIAVSQSLTCAPSTFADLASAVFNVITVPFSSGCRCVHFVCDSYSLISIKRTERDC